MYETMEKSDVPLLALARLPIVPSTSASPCSTFHPSTRQRSNSPVMYTRSPLCTRTIALCYNGLGHWAQGDLRSQGQQFLTHTCMRCAPPPSHACTVPTFTCIAGLLS